MPLTTEKANEIAMKVLQENLEKEGKIKLVPSEIKRTVSNSAKGMGIPKQEVAEFLKLILEKAYAKTIAELDKIISGKVEE
jgi:hypothetical protein